MFADSLKNLQTLETALLLIPICKETFDDFII